MNVKVVQELLRHSKAKMTLDSDTYFLSPQKRGAEQSGGHDQAKAKLYRCSTASFWGNSGNSLIRIGAPTKEIVEHLDATIA